ncbi:MAG TPA: DHA2 family efflux MFS transporter permease subunit [Terriglobales bacterium]|nr:DHA2 family efflux MFS transporter permease subunit [Terriglobales bacterium]
MRKEFAGRFESLNHEHDLYRWWVLFSIMIGTFMAVLDATIVNVALAKLMAAFGVSVDKVEWVMTAYLLVFGVMLPTSGWVADHFGYKRTYLSALFLFTFGSFLCGLAWNENILITFRIIQGIGAGFLMPVGMAIVTREFPPEKRGVALGFWAISAAASVSLGPMIGGYLIDKFSWHAIFDVNVPVGIVAIFAGWIIQREYKTEHVRSFDFLGFISLAVFLVFLLLALAEGNAAWNTGGWSSNFILSCFALSTAGLVIFLINELSVQHPLIELSLFKNFNFGLTNLVLFIFGLGMFGSTFLLPLYLQDGLGYTAFQAGAVFLPVGLLQGTISPVSGILSDRINPKIPAIIGIILMTISLYLNSFLSLFSEHYQIMFPLYLRGFAMGLLFTPLSTIALSEIPRHKIAQATGLFNVIRQIGGSFGVAILGTLLVRRQIFHSTMYGQQINQYSPAFKHISYGLQYFAQHSVGGTMAEASQRAGALINSYVAQQSFVQSINDDFLFAAVVVFIGIMPILFLRMKKKAVAKVTAVE